MKYVLGRLPNRQELSAWEESKHLSFLAFCQHFIEPKPGGTTWCVTPDKRRMVGKQVATDPYYREFLERIELPQGDTADKKFYYRLMTMVRLALGYLKLNPDRVTPTMREVITGSERFIWCLDTPIKAPALVPTAPPTLLTQEGQAAEALEKTTRVANLLLDSITEKELAKMSTKDKLLAVSRMHYIFGGKHKTGRPSSILRNLVVEKATAREMEQTLIAYSEEQLWD